MISQNPMASDNDWRLHLRTSESKSRGIDTGKSVMFSSIAGWSQDYLPKLLIVWNLDKKRAERFPRKSGSGKTKPRDLSAIISSYELFLIDSEKYIVPWEGNPSHSELVQTQWSDEWHKKLSNEVDRLHKIYSDRPIKFQKSFKNVGGIIRLQYAVSNYQKLPGCPTDLQELISDDLDKLIGAEFRLKKDLTSLGGPTGWLDNDMAKWEHENSKHPGVLHVKLGDKDWIQYPDFKKGREDYWTGYCIDFLMDKLIPIFDDLGGHQIGGDHRIDFNNSQKKIEDYYQIENKEKTIFSRIKNFFRNLFRL